MRAFAVLAYLAFLASFLYFAGFVTGLLPGRAPAALVEALAIDCGLIAFFGVTHSVMARPGFKRWWLSVVPAAAERSVFVLVASAQLALLVWQWRPVAAPVLWAVPAALVPVASGLQLAGFGLALGSSFLIDHFELFGLRQVFAPRPPGPLRTPSLYRAVRHPLYLGILVALWFAPQMSAGRLVLAAGLSVYVIAGTLLEERDLVRLFGDAYRRYQRQVPMLLPWRLGRRER